jgi:hypothetical protein
MTHTEATKILRAAAILYQPCDGCGSTGCQALARALKVTEGMVTDDFETQRVLVEDMTAEGFRAAPVCTIHVEPTEERPALQFVS